MIKINFFLDKKFKDGSDLKAIKKLVREGKSIERYLFDKETSIYVCFTARGEYVKIRCNTPKVLPKYWEGGKVQRLKRGHQLAYEINMQLNHINSQLEKEFLEMSRNSPNYSSIDAKSLAYKIIHGIVDETKPTEFWEIWKLFKDEKKKVCKHETWKKMNTFENQIKSFEKSYYKLSFEKINLDFNTDIYTYLTGKGYLNNYIAKTYAVLKNFCRWALERDYHSNTTFEKFKYREDKTDVLALNEEELNLLYHLDLSNNKKLGIVRDVFLFGCYTGQRISDLSNLKIADISFKSKNPTWSLYQIKQNKKEKIQIPLLPRALEIALKYYDSTKPIESYLLPMFSNPKMNVYIKDVCKLAKIDTPINKNRYSGKKRIETLEPKYKFISFHVSRKSFISNCLYKNIPVEIIMRISGHSSYKMMQKYIMVNDTIAQEQLAKGWADQI